MSAAPSFAPEALDTHEFLGGRLRLRQPRRGFRSGIDAVFLAAAAPAKAGETVLELGGGAGVASFCLASRVDGLALHALELQPVYADLAEQNAKTARIDLTMHRGNVSAPPASLRRVSVDGVMANPPYYREGSASAPESEAKDVAHVETAPLADWIDCALRRLRPGGWLAMIQRAERMGELLAGLEGRAGDIRVKPLAGRAGRAASRIIVTARKGARGPLVLCAPLIEHEGPAHLRDGDDYTREAQAILRHGAALEF